MASDPEEKLARAKSGELAEPEWREIRQRAVAGDSDAQYLLSFSDLTPKTRLKWLRRAAESGNVAACRQLGWETPSEKEERCEKAARLGSVSDMCALGVHFATLPTPDFVQSRHWYLKAAEGGCGVSMYEIGFTLLLGEGGPAEPEQALSWLEKAANAKAYTVDDARKLLVDLYSGVFDGLARGPERAQYWRERRAADPDPDY